MKWISHKEYVFELMFRNYQDHNLLKFLAGNNNRYTISEYTWGILEKPIKTTLQLKRLKIL